MSYSDDKSRSGQLVHEATASGCCVEITAYLEGGTHPIKSQITCRTTEQAAEIARVLREASSSQKQTPLPQILAGHPVCGGMNCTSGVSPSGHAKDCPVFALAAIGERR